MTARPIRTHTPLLALAATLSLAGCSDLDRDQAKLCRLAAVALVPGEGSVAWLRQTTVRVPQATLGDTPFPAGATGIETAIARQTGGRVTRILCAFGTTPEARLRLAAVLTDDVPLPLPRLVALQRFWLDDVDVAHADPAPVAGAAEAPALPPGTGYAIQQVIGALPGASSTALLAAAYALIYGLTGRVNLAFGAFAAVGGTATLLAILACGGLGPAVVLGVALVAALVPAAGHGVVAARLVFRPLRAASGQQVLVATIGLALAAGEYLRLAQGPQPHWAAPILDTPVALARDAGFVVTATPVALLTAGAALLAGGGLALTMRVSDFGRRWRAFRDDAGAAALCGVSPDRLLAQSFALAAAMAGLAGGIVVVMFGDMSFAYAQVLGLKALTAAVLGGIGSVEGAFGGGLFIGLVEAVWSATFPVIHRDLVTFAILVAVLVWRPGGFTGEAELSPRRV